MRRAKIVCTLGPATSSAENLKELVRAGMDVARLNLSHGDHADHEQVYADVRKASDQTGRAVGILVDLQGPKIRTARFENGPIQLVPGRPSPSPRATCPVTTRRSAPRTPACPATSPPATASSSTTASSP